MTDTNDGNDGLILFGRDISKIACFRQSFLNGIGGGLASGLAFFMLTSNVRRAANAGFAAYFGITLASWSFCRYKYEQDKIDQRKLKKAIQAKIVYEGTELEKKLEAETKDV